MGPSVLCSWSPVLVGGSLCLCYLIAKSIYRLTLHPLAKYPGPFLGKISGWYPAWHAWKGNRHIDQLRCHQLYGPIVRWGPDFVSFSSPSALQEIYGNSRTNNVRKADIYTYFNSGDEAPSTQSTLEKGPASRKRRILSHAFSDAARKASDGIIIENANRWCELLAHDIGGTIDGWGNGKNMAEYCDWWAFDTAMDLAFGKSYRLLEPRSELRYLPSYIMSGFHGMTFVGHSPIMKYWRYIVRSGIKSCFTAAEDQKRNIYMHYAAKAMTDRAEIAVHHDKNGNIQEPTRKDYFYFLSRSTDSDTNDKYTIPEIQAECTLLMNAGSNGPSVVLDATFFYLTRYPAVYARLVDEIRSTFERVEEIVSGAKMNGCIYLKAVLDEALRCCPPIFGVLPRQVLPGGQTIDGVHLPEGTILGVSAYCIHHDPKYFPDPWEFKPERWIQDDETGITADSVQTSRSAFFAFSLGGSACVGKGVAYQEMSIALARIIYQFDFRLKAGDETGAGSLNLGQGRQNPLEFQVRDVFAVITTGPMVEFRRRDILSLSSCSI